MSQLIILQTDPGWLPERRGRLTASRMNDALDYTAKGKEGAARRKYKMELVAERIADYAVDHYVSPAMQRGLDLEPDARNAYQAYAGVFIKPAALVTHPEIEWCSATTDGFIDPDGLVEFKVPLVTTWLEWVAEGTIPEQHVAQMTMQIACTRRTWVDFCAYCPEMPTSKQLFIRRFEPDTETIANVEAAAKQFLKEVDELFDTIIAMPA